MVRLVLQSLPVLLALAGLQDHATNALSIPGPSRDYTSSPRAAEIAKMRTQIVNGPRTLTIDGVEYPLYYGPLAPPASLTETMRLKESETLTKFATRTPQFLGSLAMNLSSSLTTIPSYTALYTQAEKMIEWPISTDNSDKTFGEQRTTIKSFSLRGATAEELTTTKLSLGDDDLSDICGYNAKALASKNLVFVEDYGTLGKYHDPTGPEKYIPSVQGFFCVTKDKGTLMPIEIRLLDTKLTYTPVDSADEWALAKMALEAASVAYHQMQHMAETHAVTIPLRAEAMRTMSEDHPVRALLQRHTTTDFGLELQAARQLLNRSTLLDQVIGWGAIGATQFLWDQTQNGLSMKNKAFDADVKQRGLDRIKSHKYVKYATMYHKAISTFVDAYVDVFYENDSDLQHDLELQNWANASSAIPHVRDFPSAFKSTEQLSDVLTHLVFSSTVRHHGMNGQATWHGTSAPYSPAALWHPLPKAKLQKGEKLDLLAYTAPTKVLPVALTVASMFYRQVPATENILSAYASPQFSDEEELVPAIKAFTKALEAIEKTITKDEDDVEWPYLLLRPSQLPYYTWI